MRKAPYLSKSKLDSRPQRVVSSWFKIEAKHAASQASKMGLVQAFKHQSRHAKQVRFVFQHVTKHKPLVLRNGCGISYASNARPSQA